MKQTEWKDKNFGHLRAPGSELRFRSWIFQKEPESADGVCAVTCPNAEENWSKQVVAGGVQKDISSESQNWQISNIIPEG